MSDARINGETGSYRPRITLYHPNSRGTGSAVRLELVPAHDDAEGCIMMSLASQSSAGDQRSQPPMFPRFDWENKVVVKLGFTDLCMILQVLHGECESVIDDRGLFHRSPGGQAVVKFRHVIEPVVGYWLEVSRTPDGGETATVRFLFSSAESLGIAQAIGGAMAAVCFGAPGFIKADIDLTKGEEA